MSGQIFISYRREDAPHPTGRLFDRLTAYFPKNPIFIDVDRHMERGTGQIRAERKKIETKGALSGKSFSARTPPADLGSTPEAPSRRPKSSLTCRPICHRVGAKREWF
jgi:hypothetical protein